LFVKGVAAYLCRMFMKTRRTAGFFSKKKGLPHFEAVLCGQLSVVSAETFG